MSERVRSARKSEQSALFRAQPPRRDGEREKRRRSNNSSRSNHCSINDNRESGRYNRPCSRHYSNRNPESKDRRAAFFRQASKITSPPWSVTPSTSRFFVVQTRVCVSVCEQLPPSLRPCDLAGSFPFFLSLFSCYCKKICPGDNRRLASSFSYFSPLSSPPLYLKSIPCHVAQSRRFSSLPLRFPSSVCVRE